MNNEYEYLTNDDLLEIIELIDNIEGQFVKAEKQIDVRSCPDFYKNVMRDIHSAKGTLGMIGFSIEMEAIHHVETFLIEAVEKVGFSSGIIDLMIDFWGKMSNKIQGTITDDINIYKCLNCLKENSYENVCNAHYNNLREQENTIQLQNVNVCPSRDIVFFGENVTIKNFLSENEYDFVQYNNCNLLYKSNEQVLNLKFLIVDIESSTINPFLMQSVLSKFNKHITYLYLGNCIAQLGDLLRSSKLENLKFSFISKSNDFSNLKKLLTDN